MFGRSKARAYQPHSGSFSGFLQADSVGLRVILFLAMSLVFFLFLKIAEKRIPTGLVPDSTEDTSHVVSRHAQ